MLDIVLRVIIAQSRCANSCVGLCGISDRIMSSNDLYVINNRIWIDAELCNVQYLKMFRTDILLRMDCRPIVTFVRLHINHRLYAVHVIFMLKPVKPKLHVVL